MAISGGVPHKKVQRVRAGSPLLRRLIHRQPRQIADVPGGVSGQGAEEAGNPEVHGGGLQLRRHGGIQDGGAVPPDGGGAGHLGVDPRHDGFHQRHHAGGAGVFVVVGASASDVCEGV